jgi:outer membrane protein assembly factor BamB
MEVYHLCSRFGVAAVCSLVVGCGDREQPHTDWAAISAQTQPRATPTTPTTPATPTTPVKPMAAGAAGASTSTTPPRAGTPGSGPMLAGTGGSAGQAPPVTQPIDPVMAQRYPDAPPEILSHLNDWPLPDYSFDNTRNAPTRIDSSNVSQVRESWSFPLGGGFVFGAITASPLVVGDRIYLQDMQSNVYALARDTGKELWRHTAGQITLGPNGVAIGWGKLFAAGSEIDLIALDLETGKVVWTYKPMLTSSEGIAIQPVAYGGMVYASTMPATMTRGAYTGGAIGRLFALDAETGAVRWSFDTVDSTDLWGDAATNSGGGAWFSPLIAPDYGLSYWGIGNPAPFPGTQSEPLGGSRPGPNLYTSSIVAVGLNDGMLSWYYQDKPHDIFDFDFQATPVMARASDQSGTDLVIGAGKTGSAAAVNARDGKLVWRVLVGTHENDELAAYPAGQSYQVYPGIYGGVISALAYADDIVYAASVDSPYTFDGLSLSPSFNATKGHLTAIQVSSGTVLWKAELKGASYGAATIANDLVFASDEHGHVYGFKRESGEKVWDYDAPGGINAPLVITGDELLIPAGIGDAAALIRMGLPGGTTSKPTMPAAGSSAPTMPVGEATFSAVYNDILRGRGCAAATGCHANSSAGGLDLSSRDIAYRALVNAPAQGMPCSSSGRLRVVPSDPDNSLLVNKLASAMPACGVQMPPSSLLPAALTDQIRKWIANGALDD